MALSMAEKLAALTPEEREKALEGIDPQDLLYNWDFNGRPEQIPPRDNSWQVALYLAGRGAGKTRAAAEWVREKARDTSQGPLRFLLVARTAADVREVLVEGEALALDTLVPTPQVAGGFTTMKKLKRGDIIIGGDGKPCTVTHAFAPLHDRPTYEVKISGLDKPVVADANHKWLVRRRKGSHPFAPFRVGYKVLTTEEIFNDIPTQHYIETSVVEGSSQLDLPFDPYQYGKILASRPTKKYYTDFNADKRSLSDAFLWADVETRKLLLQGFQDGVRFSEKKSRGSRRVPTTATPVMHKQLARIAASLGYKVTDSERIEFRERVPGRPKFYRYTRALWTKTSPKYTRIDSITPTASVPVRCITVDSPDHTFLITDRFIRTHNSGIMAVSPPEEKPLYQPSIRRLTWPNGNMAFCTSADEPDSLRGVQAHYSWADEVAAWRQTPDGAGMTAWDNLRVATRLGDNPQVMATTTPKRVPLLYKLLKEETEKGTVWVTRGSTFDNVGNLAGSYLDNILGTYEGTPLASQELFGEMLSQNDGALWTDEDIRNAWESDELPKYTPLRVVGVDPSVAANPSDECGIVVVGATSEREMYKRHAWVLEDASLKASPSQWAQEVVRMSRKWAAPVVVEKNQGHQLLLDAIHQIDPNIPVLGVNSSVGKKIRAEPVTMAYKQGRVHHPEGKLDALEAQMITWIPEVTRKSPDRVDALVHALTALLISPPKGFHTGPIQAHTFADRQIQIPTGSPTGIRAPKHNSKQIYGSGRYSSGTIRLGGIDKRRPR